MGREGVFGGLLGMGGEEGVAEADDDRVLDGVTSSLNADGVGVAEADIALAELLEADGIANALASP